MTYDALLATRGWGRDDFEHASKAFLAAARFAVFAERLAPVLEKAESLAAASVNGLSPTDKARLGSAKIAAGKLIEQGNALLMPADEVPGDG